LVSVEKKDGLAAGVTGGFLSGFWVDADMVNAVKKPFKAISLPRFLWYSITRLKQ
jgi:hypothetical protein